MPTSRSACLQFRALVLYGNFGLALGSIYSTMNRSLQTAAEAGNGRNDYRSYVYRSETFRTMAH